MVETVRALQHRCYRANVSFPCPADAQTAYQVQVAEAGGDFDAGRLLWDSGKVASADQIGIRYEGEALQSRHQVQWRVRVWDADGRASHWSEPGTWEMGLLEQSDWDGARWIDHADLGEDPDAPPSLTGASWIWNVAKSDTAAPPQTTIYLRRTFDVPDLASVSRARLRINVDDLHVTFVNGVQVSSSSGANAWQTSQIVDLTEHLVEGTNVVAVQATNTGNNPNPAGVFAKVQIDLTPSGQIVVVSDGSWRTSPTNPDGWNTVGFDDSA